MKRPRLFAEFPAGLAALSLYIHGGKHCRPPISRMGNKAGYAETIAATLDLRPGQGADAYWWAEADADVAALLRAYPDAALLRRIAEIIRGWAGEEPRALWERLRAERKARGPREDAEGVGGWIVTGAWAMRRGVPESGYTESRTNTGIGEGHGDGVDSMADRRTRLAEYAMIAASNRLINVAGPDLTNTGAGGTTFGGEAFATPALSVAERFEGMAREVAEHAFLHQGSFQYKGPDAGIGRPEGMEAHGTHGAVRPITSILGDSFPRLADLAGERFEGMAREVAGWTYEKARTHQGGGGYAPESYDDTARTGWPGAGPPRPMLAARFDGVSGGWPPVRVTRAIPTAAEVADALGTPGDLDGVVVYMDPPYQGTTGYAHDLGRAEVVAHARDFSALGAVVCVSEAEALPELVAVGWCVAEITEGRKGQKRTFSAQKREYLTMNREPAHRVSVQTGLFGAA